MSTEAVIAELLASKEPLRILVLGSEGDIKLLAALGHQQNWYGETPKQIFKGKVVKGHERKVFRSRRCDADSWNFKISGIQAYETDQQ